MSHGEVFEILPLTPLSPPFNSFSIHLLNDAHFLWDFQLLTSFLLYGLPEGFEIPSMGLNFVCVCVCLASSYECNKAIYLKI